VAAREAGAHVAGARFAGRVAFVTGAARGLGEAIAAAFVADGAAVALCDADPAVDATAARLDPSGARTLALRADVRDESSLRAAFDAAVARFGAVDAMVNDAAVMGPASPWGTSPDAWDEVMAVNLRGTFFGCRIAGAHMRARRRGRIVNLGSYAGTFPSRASGPAYAASKAGIASVTRSFATELAPAGVTVNAVAPSAIEGPQWDAADLARRAALLESVPLGRAGRPGEVAAVVLFLASDAAGWITGQTVDVNGGRGMR
jgi:3-oxoacyl-[acyl-carrier protein] reductase